MCYIIINTIYTLNECVPHPSHFLPPHPHHLSHTHTPQAVAEALSGLLRSANPSSVSNIQFCFKENAAYLEVCQMVEVRVLACLRRAQL